MARMRLRGWIGLALGLLTPTIAAGAAPGRGTRAGVAPDRIEVYPPEVRLDGRRDYRQLVITGYVHGVPHDLTRDAVYSVTNTHVLACRGSRVTAVGPGRAAITVRVGGHTLQASAVVTHFDRPDAVRFAFEALPVLTKQGCATGACHGSPHGKGGFSLSLFGYDPRIDRIALTRDGFNRRVNVLEPDESLMLKKPQLEIPHVGGKRLRKTDAAYAILRNWIAEGADAELPAVACARIVVYPDAARVLHTPYLKQQLSVIACFTDGTTRDVTAIATYDSSNKSVAVVDADGLVTGKSRGQAAISVRYLDKLVSAYITVVEDVPGFHWNNPPENNVVDRLTDQKLRQLQYLPSETCDDATFLRRISLDLTGLLPTPETTRRFLQDRSPDRRAKLIDALLETEEYARFWGLKLADLMRVSPGRLPDGRAERFARWIVDTVRANMPYDRFARAILTATGDTLETPPANYFLAISTTEERTEMTAQIFLGSRIECARCHNHPFEKWTMRDYYSIGAVFARTQADKGKVTLAATGEVMHPTTHETMTPWGTKEAAKQGKTSADRRVAFADWLTRPDNPLFARVAVNRMWAELMGRGIVEPVDDFRSSNPPANVPLLEALEHEFVRSGYDRKQILRLICNSRTYQRSCRTHRLNETEETLFSHARIRLLTAEQLKDAIGFTTRVLPPTSALERQRAELVRQSDALQAQVEAKYAPWLREMTAPAARKNLPKRAVELLTVPAERRTEAERQELHALYLANDADLTALRRQIADVEDRSAYATQRLYPEASTFTVTFGQPQRATACTCERQTAPTLLQALELLNGDTTYRMALSGTANYAAMDNDRLIEELYLSGLCRLPTDRERGIARRYLTQTGSRNTAVMDLVWTFINTQEFLFQH